MNWSLKIGCLFLALFSLSNNVLAQDEAKKLNKYIGIGIGLDYGGVAGWKIEILPDKNIGLFMGTGHNSVSICVNGGIVIKILPDKKICPNLLMLYGYNGILLQKSRFKTSSSGVTSIGPTFWGTLDFRIGKKFNKLSVGLLIPIRSNEFLAVKNSPYMNIENTPPPIVFSCGFNLRM